MPAVELTDGVVRLRGVTPDDVDGWMAGEDEEQTRWFEFPGPAPRENVEQAIRGWASSWETGGFVRQWGICEAGRDQVVGGVEVHDLGGQEVNLSYVVFPPARRRGLATRAARLALGYAATGMGARVAVLRVLEGNEASLGVARRLGAVDSGREPSERGGRFVVLRLDLNGWAGRSSSSR
jgi:RimJ/RimL family protein N-acetyltransferase